MGHLRLKSSPKLDSWPGGDTTAIPVIQCDEWTEAQVKAFRLPVNRSVTWAGFDEESLAPNSRISTRRTSILAKINLSRHRARKDGRARGETGGTLGDKDKEIRVRNALHAPVTKSPGPLGRLTN
jgi:hypothetical protein